MLDEGQLFVHNQLPVDDSGPTRPDVFPQPNGVFQVSRYSQLVGSGE